jgi:low affinity Fe/Cu permease
LVRQDRPPTSVREHVISAPKRKKSGGDTSDAAKWRKDGGPSKLFGERASRTSQAAGRVMTFIIAGGVVLAWAVTGPIFQYSDTWQLVINTGTTIVTFLMVFLIKNSQNRDSAAIQLKLDELIRVSTAHNSFVGIERLTGDELDDIRIECERRADAERIGEQSVERTGKKAKRAVDRVNG